MLAGGDRLQGGPTSCRTALGTAHHRGELTMTNTRRLFLPLSTITLITSTSCDVEISPYENISSVPDSALPVVSGVTLTRRRMSMH